MLEISTKALHKEIEEARQRIAQDGPSWLFLEPLARCLHWLNDPQAAATFREAAQRYPLRSDDPSAHIHVGNYYRLAGDRNTAYSYFERAYSLYHAEFQQHSTSATIIARFINPCFLLGYDTEVTELATLLRELDPNPVVAHTIARLSHARQTCNMKTARAVVDQLAESIRLNRSRITATGDITLWDWYELARDLMHALEQGAKPESTAPRAPLVIPPHIRRPFGDQEQYAAQLDGRNYRGAQLPGAQLAAVDLTRANLVEANLHHA
ncbi:MAG: pentapeptide repeat-containing protein, partial [Chloroflexales bacterium]|nr:pentapeptide repeat-containing protein [Chloroflexales bacterium]